MQSWLHRLTPMNFLNYIPGITVCLAVLASFDASAFGGDIIPAGNPYTAIAAHNIFGLTPPEIPPTVSKPKSSPPKITATGIMSLFGQAQVLFKVNHAGEAGQPAKTDSYILGLHERQDDIEVTRIDSEAGVVTFDNHGLFQHIPLAGTLSSDAPTSTAVEPPSVPNLHPASFESSRTPDYLGGGPGAIQNGQPYRNTTTEERIILIEAQRAYLRSRNDPAADLLPPTALTPAE